MKGEFSPNESFDKYKELFRLVTFDFEYEEKLSYKAEEKIETDLDVTMLDHEDYTRQQVDVFIKDNICTWREEYGDSEWKYIYFYRVKEPYGEFSNFWPPSDDEAANKKFKLVIDGVSWKTTEHYYQAMKFEGLPEELIVRNAKNAYLAAKLGNQLSPLRSDWDSCKDEIMYKAVYAKFDQNVELKEILLKTGKSQLIEHTKNDSYWADGGDGSGKNMLGKILMKVRAEILIPML